MTAVPTRRDAAFSFSALVANPSSRVLLLLHASEACARRGIRVLAVLLRTRIATRYGCYLPLTASFGPGLRLPHPTGIVVGHESVIGRNVTIYQGVTIGRQRPDTGYPTIGDDVTIYAGAFVLGDITIGDRAVVGANSMVITDVPPDAVVAGSPARVVA